MTLDAGTRLGPYEILGLIGAGGMGEVYRASDPRIGREVAVKVLPAAFAKDPNRLRRFEQEVQAAGTLNHPNILVIHDVGSHNGIPYLVSELLEGETLRTRLNTGPLSQSKAIDYARQIAQGLAAAHDKEIVHRDLKPDNLFVTTDGRIKILDFGLAKFVQSEAIASQLPTVDDGTQPGAILGTVGYLSPEQVRGRSVDSRSDIFSLGVVLYEMLSGRRAFGRDNAADSMSAILKEDPPPLASPTLNRIVQHCLEKNSTERFQSARDFAFQIEAVSAIDSASAIGTLPAPSSSSRVPIFLAGAMVLVVVALGAVWLGRRLGTNTEKAVPIFKQLTFRRGTINSARFAPDGQTIVYGAAWEGKPLQLFSTRPESPESRSLGLPDADLLSISPSGEMAISLGRNFYGGWMSRGTLARAPLAGGAPREVLENVQEAAWASKDSRLAVVRSVEGKYRLEYPVGNVLFETSGWLSHPRVSPQDDLIAFIEHPVTGDDNGLIAVVDMSGKKRNLTERYAGGSQGLAWNPSGDEIWYSAAENGTNFQIFAVSARSDSARPRTVTRIPGRLTLHDIFRDGRVLASRDVLRPSAFVQTGGENRERDLTWLDLPFVADLSPDGKTLLFSEEGVAGGRTYSVYLRKTDGSPAVRLGEGQALGLSPDGRSALAIILNPPQLSLLPTGAGEPKVLPKGPIESYNASASWFPDGKRIAFAAVEPGHKFRVYVQDVAGGPPRAISPEGFGSSAPLSHAVSPDGRQVVISDSEGKVWLFPADGGERTPVLGLERDQYPIQWTPDSKSLYISRQNEVPAKIFRLNIVTGRKDVVREILPSDPAGLIGFGLVQVSPDGTSYGYTCFRLLSDLYMIEGLK